MGPKHSASNCNQQAAASHHLAAQQCQVHTRLQRKSGTRQAAATLHLDLLFSCHLWSGEKVSLSFPTQYPAPSHTGTQVHTHTYITCQFASTGGGGARGEQARGLLTTKMFTSLLRGSKHKSIVHHSRLFYKLWSSQVRTLSANIGGVLPLQSAHWTEVHSGQLSLLLRWE